MAAGSTNWVDIQEKAFVRWANDKLKQRGMRIDNLVADVADGILFINLLEIISGKSLGNYNRNPRMPIQKVENNTIVLNFLAAEGIKTVNIGPEDITYGRQKLILGLLWTIILRYQIAGISDSSELQAKNELLEWVRSKVVPEGYDVHNFTRDWNDGRVICALVHALDPALCVEHRRMDTAHALENATTGITVAQTQLGVPVIVEPGEMINPKVDEHAMMIYIAQFRDLEQRGAFKRRDDSQLCSAHGDGLTDGVVNVESGFVVDVPPGCRGKLEVKVVGPKTEARAVVIKRADGSGYDVKYTPTEPGTWHVHVTLDGKHIPGSVFTVTVLQRESLGGEGKIRVFYSTTSCKNVITRPLQELLEKKGVHLRPDFEPWIAVDVLERDDREAVFRVAGTRKLPIVYVDDNYYGSTDELFALDRSGELDRLLKVNADHYADLYAPGKRSPYLLSRGSTPSTVPPAPAPRPTATVSRQQSATTTTTTTATARPTAVSTQPKKPTTTLPTTSAPAPAAATGGGAAAKFCGNCGTKLNSGVRFCSSCGTKVSQ